MFFPPPRSPCTSSQGAPASGSPSSSSPNQGLLTPHLHQAVPHQPQQQAGTVLLLHSSRTLCPHHACEVKGRDIRPPVGIFGKLQLPELAIGGEVSSCPGKALQSLGDHIRIAQQAVGVLPVLETDQNQQGQLGGPSPWAEKVHTLRP